MLSKFLLGRIMPLLKKRLPAINRLPKRGGTDYIPPTQYDSKWPRRLNVFSALRSNYELYPLIGVTCFAGAICVMSIANAFGNKVDVTYSHRLEDTISRTMDLRHPTIHKLVTINQEYHPWPEMQETLDLIKEAERKMKLRTSCTQSSI